MLVDFWAEWCGPCKMIAPLIDEIAKEKAGTVKVAKVNVDENQSLSMKYNVRAIPALLFFKNGQLRDQVIGMTSKKDLLGRLDALARRASQDSANAPLSLVTIHIHPEKCARRGSNAQPTASEAVTLSS